MSEREFLVAVIITGFRNRGTDRDVARPFVDTFYLTFTLRELKCVVKKRSAFLAKMFVLPQQDQSP